MINFYLKTTKDNQLKTISRFQKNCLIYCVEPSKEELDFLQKKIFLDENLIQDALDPNEIPRAETKSGIIYIFLRVPFEKDDEITTMSFLVVISSKFFLILTNSKNELLDKFINKADFYTTKKTRIFIQILSEIIKRYDFFVSQINKKVRGFGLNLQRVGEKEIKQFVYFEIILQDFISALLYTKYLFSSSRNKSHLELFSKDKELIVDLLLEIEQIENILKANIKNIINIREAHENILTNSVNRAVKLLTALTIIVSVPTIIASFYGMNVSLPLSDKPLVFEILAFSSVVLMILLLFIFRNKKWL